MSDKQVNAINLAWASCLSACLLVCRWKWKSRRVGVSAQREKHQWQPFFENISLLNYKSKIFLIDFH